MIFKFYVKIFLLNNCVSVVFLKSCNGGNKKLLLKWKKKIDNKNVLLRIVVGEMSLFFLYLRVVVFILI